MSSKIIIQSNLGMHFFQLIAANGEPILNSGKFRSALLCTDAAKQFQQAGGIADRFEKVDVPIGQHYFVVKDEDGKVIAKSDNFWSAVSRNYVMSMAKKECESAIIDNEQRA